jgi:rubrerythrin
MPSDVELVRQVLARELETINQYEQAAREADTELIRAFFRHLADEEKEHVAEAIQLLHQLDGAQRARASKVDVRLEHFGGAPAHRAAAEHPAPPTPQATRSFTVGSLKRRKDEP